MTKVLQSTPKPSLGNRKKKKTRRPNQSVSLINKNRWRNVTIHQQKMYMPIGPSIRAEPPMDVHQNHRDELRRRLPRCTGSPRFPSWVGLPRLRAHSYTGPATQRFRRRRWSLPFSCPHFSGPCLGMGPEYRITARPRRAFP